MPPRTSLTSSFSVTDASLNNEVVCPLKNQDGSLCRKRCVGEKRYRSMQEHIRRAHPEHYISKLPATEESFNLMVNTPPTHPQPQQPQPPELLHASQSFPHDRYLREATSNPGTPRTHPDDFAHSHGHLHSRVTGLHPSNAAAALAQLHSHKIDQGWESEPDTSFSDNDGRIPRSSIELPPILGVGDLASPLNLSRQREILPSLLAGSPPGRSSTLPPLQRPLGPGGRPRKQSVSKRGREAHHRKQKSRGSGADIFRRLDDRLRPGHHDRKALSAEPSADYGKRWEDLIDAADQAASAAGDLNEERTPVSSWPLTPPNSRGPRSDSKFQVPQSPVSVQRASLPPFSNHLSNPFHAAAVAGNNYQASPLQQALTPPAYAQEPFPSVESNESGSGVSVGVVPGDTFHMEPRGLLSDSSPSFSSQNTQIYCAACQGVSLLRESYACTECICGLCQACVDVLLAEQGARRQCPRCSTIGGKFKPFQLDIR
jgi:hypothetical protein